MDKQQLRDHLQQLHVELSDNPPGDEQSRELMRQLVADLERVLGRVEVEAPPEPEDEHIGGRLEDAMLQFQADHPTFSGLLGKMGEGLSRFGI